MDTKRLITLFLVSMVLIVGWQLFVASQFEKHPEWFRPGEKEALEKKAEEAAATQPVTQVAQVEATQPSTGTSTTRPAMTAQTGTFRVVSSADAAQITTLGSSAEKDPNYSLAATISPRGAGLESVVLNQFHQEVEGKQPYTFQQPYADEGPVADNTRALATRAIIINGTRQEIASAIWQREGEPSATSASYFLDMIEPGGARVKLTKTFEIFPRNHPSEGYEIAIRHSISSDSPQPLKVSIVMNGPTAPAREMDRGPDRQFIAAYDDGGKPATEHYPAESFTEKENGRSILKNDDGQPALWYGTASVYFNAIVLPMLGVEDNANPAGFAAIWTEALNPAAEPHERLLASTFQTNDVSISQQETALPIRAYFGPKDRGVLAETYYSSPPRWYDLTLIITGGCAFCTFQWLVDGLVWLLRGFHIIFRDWGLAIIALVIIVRLILHPITKRSTISMHKMSKLQPEIERLRKKYGDNKDELNRAMMGFYKEHGGSQVMGCLPMFLQMPIWIALWQSLQTTFELRHAPFLYGLTWINDLAKPDHLITWNPIPLIFGMKLGALNILPLLLAVVFYLQNEFQPKPEAMTKEQEQQRKMMKWMSLLFPIFLYNGPSGLNLYILTSTTIGIIESKRIRDHIKEREVLEAQQRVIIDAKPTRGSKRRDEAPAPEKKGGLMGWFADLQKRAEELRNEQQRRKK